MLAMIPHGVTFCKDGGVESVARRRHNYCSWRHLQALPSKYRASNRLGFTHSAFRAFRVPNHGGVSPNSSATRSLRPLGAGSRQACGGHTPPPFGVTGPVVRLCRSDREGGRLHATGRGRGVGRAKSSGAIVRGFGDMT